MRIGTKKTVRNKRRDKQTERQAETPHSQLKGRCVPNKCLKRMYNYVNRRISTRVNQCLPAVRRGLYTMQLWSSCGQACQTGHFTDSHALNVY